MTPLPTVHQFPTFANTHSWLKRGLCQCIWYLPNERRCCKVKIQPDENQLALQLATKLSEACPSTTVSFQKLAEIAERSCCARHHRNKIWGTNLAKNLAILWQNEIQETLCVTGSEIVQTGKLEKMRSPTYGTGHTQINCMPVDREFCNSRTQCDSRPIAFSKHAVLEGQTLASTLLSVINPSASTVGSVYIFTYANPAFEGMLKIGFTSRPIYYRLDEWAECGHGTPSLLQHYQNVRQPERVELLTHFELMRYWYALRWCNFHSQAHIEWFKTGVSSANSIVKAWSSWIERANPYDRRGRLKAFWEEILQFLAAYEIYITAELMMQIQEVEEGAIDVATFVDDDELTKQHDHEAKQHHLDKLCGAFSSLKPTEADPAAERHHEVKSTKVKIEIAELQNESDEVGLDPIPLEK
jgi:hypothetical protein